MKRKKIFIVLVNVIKQSYLAIELEINWSKFYAYWQFKKFDKLA